MANAEQILERKGGGVITISPDATVLKAAQAMNEHHVGSLVVVDGGRLAGIFTERDVMRRVVAEQRDASVTKVGEVMTNPVACATPETSRDELSAVMREKRIRHIPVVRDEKVIGMISIGDLNRAANDEHVRTIQFLEQYISVS